MSHATASTLASLRRRVARIEQRPAHDSARVPLDHAGIDRMLGGGLALGRLHEMFAAEAGDVGAAAGFAAMLAALVARKGPIVWMREQAAEACGRLYAPGLAELGLDPARLVLVHAADSLTLLRAAAEVVRCPEIGAAVVELWRRPRVLDLTASRRLAVAAETSDVTVLMPRIAAEPEPSAAQTRWRVRAAPSTPLEADAPGMPALDLELVRQRGGAEGGRWRVEWNRDARIFKAALPGAVVSLAEHRPAAAGG